METFIMWAGFLGAWSVVAGSVYQASLELQEQEFRREDMVAASAGVHDRARLSPWWWLLPPVAYVLQRRRDREVRRVVMERLTPAQLESFVDYVNKATGWVFVGVGGLLISLKETWELSEHYEWSVPVFWLLAAVAAGACAVNAAARVRRGQQMVEAAR